MANKIKAAIQLFWRRKWIIIIPIILSPIVTTMGTVSQTPMYRAAAALRLTPSTGTRGYVNSGSIVYSERLMQTYAQVAPTGPIVEEMKEDLGITEPTGALGRRVSVAFGGNNDLLYILFEDEDPQFAADAANAMAEVMVNYASETSLGNIYPLEFIEPANPAPTPFEPRVQFNIIMSVVFGIIGGVGFALVLEIIDTTLHTTKHIEKAAGLPLLGRIPPMSTPPRITSIDDLNGSSPLLEAFRRLRTNIFAVGRTTSIQTWLVTSTRAQEGTSTIVTNLAMVLAQSGRKVVLVDSNLHTPTLHEIFNLPNEVGLSNVLSQEVSLEDALQQRDDVGIAVLTSGPLLPNPDELLSMSHMKMIISTLSAEFDMVLLDSPPLLRCADAAVLSLLVQDVLIVVAHPQARREMVRAALQQLTELKVRPVGIIVNQTTEKQYYAPPNRRHNTHSVYS